MSAGRSNTLSDRGCSACDEIYRSITDIVGRKLPRACVTRCGVCIRVELDALLDIYYGSSSLTVETTEHAERANPDKKPPRY